MRNIAKASASWMFRLGIYLFNERWRMCMLEALIQQANEAKAAHDAALAATDAVTTARGNVAAADEALATAQSNETAAYQEAAQQLQEANDALLAYVNSLPQTPAAPTA